MKYIRKIVILVLAMVIVSAMVPNSVHAASNKSKSSVKFVKLTKDYKLKVKFCVKAKKGATYGHGLSLERYEKGKWKKLNMKDGVAWNEVAECVSGPCNIKYTYDLGFYYYEDELIPGKYRLKADINFKNPYVKFTIKRKAPKSGKYYDKTKAELKSVKGNTVTVRFCNGSKKETYASRQWGLERKEKGKWIYVEPIEQLMYTDDVIGVSSKTYTDYSYYLLEKFDKSQLVPGKYRILTGYLVKNSNVEFEIK